MWDRDKSKSKDKAAREISYIVFLYDYKSPYQAYPESQREKKIREDYFSDEPDWEPDEYVEKAMQRFLEFQDTATLRLLRSTKYALEAINEYFKNANPDNIDKIVKNAKELGSLVQSLEKLEDQVQKEQMEKNSARGGQDVGMFEL